MAHIVTILFLLSTIFILKQKIGEDGIRTRDTINSYTRFPSVRLQPLGHLSND